MVAGSAVGSGNASTSAAELQWRYDVSYAQCMTASGSHVQAFPVAWPYGPYENACAYPAYDSPWFGPVSLGSFGGFGPRFHHPAFVHHGFHHGFHNS